MAKGQQQGAKAVTLGMFVFAALWLTSTVLLVIMYTGQEDLRKSAADCETFNSKLISQRERSGVAQFQAARPGGPTVVGLLEGARAQTALLASGDETDDVGGVRAKLEQLQQSIQGDGIVPEAGRFQDLSYHESLTMLYEVLKGENALRSEAEARVAELGGEVDRLVEATAQLQSDFEQRTKELSDQFAEAEAQRGQYRTEKDEQLAALQRGYEDRRSENDADLTRERQQNTALQQEVDRLESRLVALQEQVGDQLIGPKALATARTPDGSILQHIPGDEFVFIDLGQRAKLVRGMRFAVYSGGKEIPLDGRAKAQIEVVAIDPASSECRIVRQAAGEVILPGDLIANPIYDPQREVRFLVLGEFDLDHDGLSDGDGVERIGALVTEWGGTLTSDITAMLDFVVVGRSPRRPRPPRDQTPEATERFDRLQGQYDKYVQTLQSAGTLQIPVLRQEVFLNFLGYADRYASR